MSWFDKPSDLFKTDKIMMFWPNENQSANERINASTRFILYLTCILYVLKRDIRIFALAGIAVAVLYVMTKAGSIQDSVSEFTVSKDVCQRPKSENPFANVIMTDYEKPNRKAACQYDTVEQDVKQYSDDMVDYETPPMMGRSRGFWPSAQKNAAARQFYSNPVTSIPGDQTAFAEWCYGKKNSPMCRDDPSQCNPDYWGVQSEAFSGLDVSGNARSGMSGRGNGT